jgi:hypothetical protein
LLYPEFSKHGFKSKLESPTQIGELSELQIPQQPAEFYTSLYRFDSSVGSLASLANLPSGLVAYADYLLIDLDSHADLGPVYADGLRICAALEKIGAKYQLWFSGNKGFHVYIPTSQFGFEPTADEGILKRMAEAIAGGSPFFDPAIYNKTRIFRYPCTFNQKGGFYKTVIGKDWSLDFVKEMAKNEPAENELGLDETNLPLCQPLVQIYEACKVKINRSVQENIREHSNNLFVMVKEGGRNEAAYTLARKLARRGFNTLEAEFVTQSWNKQLPKPLAHGEITKVVQSAYTKGMNEFVDEGTFAHHIYEIGRAIEECSTTFQNQGKNCFLTGYDFLDKLSGGFYAGEVTFIAARNGNFKTAFLDNILQRGSQVSQRPVLFLSQEMPNATLTLRRVQKVYGLTKKQAIEWVTGKHDRSALLEAYKHVKTCYLSNLGVEEILGLIDFYTETFGPLAAVGIDYLGLCKGANNNREKTARMATDMKTRIARAANAPVFVLSQAKQIYEGDKGSIELDRACFKDSDTVIDSADYAFGCWKKWHTQGADRFNLIFGKVLKDRGMDVETFGQEPYFYLDLDKPCMNLKDIVFCDNPPPFDQLSKDRKGGDE